MDTACHPGGRLVEAAIAREIYCALGFEVCERCHRVTAIRWRHQRFAPTNAASDPPPPRRALGRRATRPRAA